MIGFLIRSKEHATNTWACPHCQYTLNYHGHDSDIIGFFVVRHLRKHGLTNDEILVRDPSLLGAVKEYEECYENLQVTRGPAG